MTLGQLFTWVTLRDRAAVRLAGEATGSAWVARIELAGGTRIVLDEAGKEQVLIFEAPLFSIDEANAQIMGALKAGTLRCRAFYNGERDWVHPDKWLNLKFNFGQGTAYDPALPAKEWIDLQFPTSEVLMLWAPIGVAPAESATNTAEAGSSTRSVSRVAESKTGTATPVDETESAKLATVETLAEYVFEQHREAFDEGRMAPRKIDLRDKADRLQRNSKLPKFTSLDFDEAYQRVYATKKQRPPRGGWPLQPPYKARLD
ncbi:MAG: hypothetical protein ACHQRJ_05135 [Alphaproteobacteria bacterium]